MGWDRSAASCVLIKTAVHSGRKVRDICLGEASGGVCRAGTRKRNRKDENRGLTSVDQAVGKRDAL